MLLGTAGALVPAPAMASPGLVVTDLNNGVTKDDLANALFGSGVTVSNVTYTGAPRAAGKFSGGATSVGFPNGIILDSGKVQTYASDPACSRGVEGPNTCHELGGPAGGANSTAFGTPGDAQLTVLSGFTTFDASILQFDFVPQFSSVQFQYVFSSEEYSDFSNTAFNDVFGFFINGTNCALVPGTTLPVSINTINNGNDGGGDPTPHNAAFFRDNVRPTPTIDIQMDGLTTVLTCNATVNAGATNHMKLAIADASDAILDSAVFLKGGSLSSGTVMTTSLSGGGMTGAAITVPEGTAVTDSATLTGANASTAGGTVTYNLYADATCSLVIRSAGTKTVTNGAVPNSDPVTMIQAGTVFWTATYSGDALNNPSTTPCGSETVTVINPEQPIAATGTNVSATEGAPFAGTVATFTDQTATANAAEYTATIAWGDGFPATIGIVSGPIGGPFAVTGMHAYAEEGTYTVTVTITDIDNAANGATATSTATVTDAALTASCAVLATSSQSFSGPTATFTDAASPFGTLSDFTATINWGDGTTSAGTVTGPDGGPYSVSGIHTYSSTGPFTITTTINDVGGSSTSTPGCTGLVFAFAPGGGSFAIGDNNSANGTTVTFWGAKWWKLNSLSGGSAPASFKGFAEAPTTPACGVGWSADTGNSTPPPAGPLPAFMGVMVTSSATQSGSTDFGDTVHIVVVQTNPGYQPNPGHPGTGTVVGQVC